MAFRVTAVVERSGTSHVSPFGRVRLIGRTPASSPLKIPKCLYWFVEPLDNTITDETLGEIAKEIKAQGIPGLALTGCNRLTDRGMKKLSGLKNLVFLGIQGTVISSVGMSKLKGLSGLRVLDGRPGALSGLEWIKGFKSLEYLDVSGHRVLQGPKLKALRPLRNLHTLHLRSISLLNDRGMEQLLALKKLRTLHVCHGVSLTTAGVDVLSKMKKLEALHVDGLPVTNASLAKIKKMPALTSLSIRGAGDVTDEGAEHLASMTGLRRLDVGGCYGLTDAGILKLGALENLEAIRFMASRGITEKGFAVLKHYARLQELAVEYVKPFGDECMEHVAGASKLERLLLRQTSITDGGLKHLADKANLRFLSLPGCGGVEDGGLTHLRLLPLIELDLSDTAIGDKGLAHIGAIPTLETLSLAKCSVITDAGVEHLAGLTNLVELDLREASNITDEAVDHIKKLSSLLLLKTAGTGLTVRGERSLKEALPGCRVVR